MNEKIPETELPPLEEAQSKVIDGHFPEVGEETKKDNVVQMPTPNEVIANREKSWQEHMKVTPLDLLRNLVRTIENEELPIDGILVLGGHWDNDDPNTFMPTLARAKLTDTQLVFLLEWARQELFTRYIAVR